MTDAASQVNKYSANIALNGMKTWLARLGINAFLLSWKIAQGFSLRSMPAKSHYYIMRLFRLFFKTFYVWISYPNPLAPQKTLRLLVNLCENNQQWYFRQRGAYDLMEIRLEAEGMQSADVFIDVGANVGIYAITIAQAFPEKNVLAIEPLDKNFNTLQTNIAANGLINCRALQGAVSSAGTPLRFYVNPIHDGGGSLIAPSVYRTGDVVLDAKSYQKKHPEFRSWEEVKAFSLDEVLSQKSVLKIDVEGTEVDVLQSGYETLKAGLVHLMVIEVLQETVDEVVRLVDELKFDSFLLPDYVPVAVGTQLPWFVRNIVCVRKNTPLHTVIRKRAKQ
jgi:FkbM family methyltransferase